MGTLLPVIQSDIMLESQSGDTVLIIDAKYYTHTLAENRFNARMLHSANLYQIFTYVKNKDKDMGDGEHSVSVCFSMLRQMKKYSQIIAIR